MTTCHVPFTYFAHQVPVLPVKMRNPDRWDGLALVVGSVMPDLWYVTMGWGFGPAGIPMFVNGHGLVEPGRNIIPVLVIVWAVRRFVAPVVPLALPTAGVFRLHDYRLLAGAHHRWWVTVYSAAFGAFTHVLLDGFTHRDGFVVEAVPAMTEPMFQVAGHGVTLARLLQVVGSVGGVAAGVWMLVVIGRRHLMRRWHGYEGRPPAYRLTPSGLVKVRAVLAIGAVPAVAYGVHRFDVGFATALMGTSWVMLGVMVVAGLVGRRHVEPVVA